MKIKSIDNRGEKWYYALMKMSLRIFSIIIVSALLLTGIGIYLAQAQKPVENAVKGVQTQSEPLNADKILELVNAERAKVGVAPLVSDQRLVASAQTKADDMATNNYYGHINPTTGVNGYEFIPRGICIYKSENINAAITSQEAVNEWLASQPHHDAMLDAKYSLTGIALAKNPKADWYYVVQHFCQQ